MQQSIPKQRVLPSLEVTFISPQDLTSQVKPGNANPNSKAAEATSRRRKLAQLVGNKYTLVVKGRFIDYPFDGKTANQISDDVFGTLGGE